MVTLLIGRGGTGKSQEIFHRMAAAGETRRQLLIVPEQHSHLAERRLCAAGGSALSLSGEVLTFTRLASRVFGAHGGLAKPTLDGGGRLLVMYLAATKMSQTLSVYARPSRKPAFLTGLLATLDECKSYRVPPEVFFKAGETLGGAAGGKLRDLSLIFNAYDSLCETLGADPRDKLTRLAAALTESRWAEGMDVYLDGFTDFTPQEGLVISALMAQAHSVTFALTCDHVTEDEDGLGVFSPARRTAAFVTRLGADVGQRVEVETLTTPLPGKVPALVHLEQNLFADSPIPWEGEAPVTCVCAPDLRREVEWTAAEILRLVREEGYRFRDIAVTGRTFEGYQELVESVFPRYGIPVFQSRSQDILEKPVLALITAALDTVSGGYRYEDIFRYLKTGLAGVTDEERDRLENYVLTWDIRGSRWTAQTPWHAHPRGFGERWREEDEAAVAALDGLRRRIAAPLETLRKSPGVTGAHRAVAVYQFLEDISLPETLERRVTVLRERGELGLAEEYSQLWAILIRALEQSAVLLENVEMTLEEFSRLFALTLSQYRVSAIPVALDRLTAGPCPRLGYQQYKAVFFLGCDDKHVPLCAQSPGLLTDADRETLRQAGYTLAPKTEEKLHREMTIAYNACTLPTRRLYLSYPAGVAGEERRGAFLIGRMARLFPQRKLIEGAALGEPRLAAAATAMELAPGQPLVAKALRELPGCGFRLDALTEALRRERGNLSPAGVRELYGEKIKMSASQLDLYRSCHFSHFMRYGLAARPRQKAEFDAIEYGTFVHAVLERVVRQWKKGSPKEMVETWTKEAIRNHLENELGGMEGKSPRFVFLFHRLEALVARVVDNVLRELEHSDFTPVAFELGFARGKDMPPVELRCGDVTVSVSGFIDRVDGWEKDGKLYLRVMDYKTGKKPFDLRDILSGIGLQMLLYLSTLEREGESVFHSQVVPAGVLYIPAREILASGSRDMTEEERQAQVDKALTRQGLVVDDPAILEAMEHTDGAQPRFLPIRINKDGQFTGDALASAERLGKLMGHVDNVLREVGKELSAGVVSADPYWRGPEHNACVWCPYRSACQFEAGKGGEDRRWNRGMNAKEFWEALDC